MAIDTIIVTSGCGFWASFAVDSTIEDPYVVGERLLTQLNEEYEDACGGNADVPLDLSGHDYRVQPFDPDTSKWSAALNAAHCEMLSSGSEG